MQLSAEERRLSQSTVESVILAIAHEAFEACSWIEYLQQRDVHRLEEAAGLPCASQLRGV
jgi:hypothetical protein